MIRGTMTRSRKKASERLCATLLVLVPGRTASASRLHATVHRGRCETVGWTNCNRSIARHLQTPRALQAGCLQLCTILHLQRTPPLALASGPRTALDSPYRRVRRVWCVIIEQPGCGSMRVVAYLRGSDPFAGFGMIFIRTTNDRPVRSVRTVFVSFRFTFTLHASAYTVRSAPVPSGHRRGARLYILQSIYFIPPAQRRLASYARCAHVSDVVRVLTLWLRSRSRVHRPGIRSRDTPRCRVRVRGRGGGACRVPLFDPTASTSGAAPLPRAYDEHYVPARGQLLTSPSAARERDMQAHSSLETKSVTNALRRNDGAYAPRTAAFDLFPKNSSFFSRRVKIRACGAGRPTRCPIQARSNVGSVGCLL